MPPGDRRLGHGALDVSRPHPGWSEQDPADWIRATEEAVAELKAHARARSSPRSRASAFPARCTAPRCSTPPTRCCAPASCGTTRGAMPRRPHSTPIRDFRHAHRQHRLSRLHRAKARLGEEQRARHLRAGPQGAAAEGLSAALADRRAHVRNVGFGRHVLARRREARAGRPSCSPRPTSRSGRCPRSSKAPSRPARCAPSLPREWGMGGRRRRRRRGRRQCGVGLRHGHGRGRARPSSRSARRACCLPPTAPICPIPKAPCTPSATRCPTPGTRWASSCRRPIRSTGCPASPARSRGALTGELGDELQGAGRRHLPALSLGRAHAAQRCGDPRLVHRARPRIGSRGADAGGARRRRLRLPRQPRGAAGRRHAAFPRDGDRRRLALALLAEGDRHRARRARRHSGRRRFRRGLRRRPARPDRRRERRSARGLHRAGDRRDHRAGSPRSAAPMRSLSALPRALSRHQRSFDDDHRLFRRHRQDQI